MPNRLFLKPELPLAGESTQFEWAVFDITGQRMAHALANTIDDIEVTMMQNDIDNAEMVVLLPSSVLSDSPVAVPAKQVRYLKQALPFLIEDQISQDIEDVHIVLGKKVSAEEHQVMVCNIELFESLFNLLTSDDRAFSLKAIHSEAQLLPNSSEDITLFCDSAGVALKHANGCGLSLNEANLLNYIDTIVQPYSDPEEEEISAPVELDVKAYIPQDDLDQFQMLMAQLGQYADLHINTETVFLSRFEMLCESYFQQGLDAINLCQAPFEVKKKGSGSFAKWKAVAVVAGIWFILQLGLFVGKGMYYEQEADKYSDQAVALYKKYFPNSKAANAGNLNRIIKGKLNQSGDSSTGEADFLTMLGEAGYQFSRVKNKTNFEFSSISFNKQRGELVIEMRANSFDQLDQLKNAIVAQGLTAKISSAVQEESYYRGRINVSGG